MTLHNKAIHTQFFKQLYMKSTKSIKLHICDINNQYFVDAISEASHQYQTNISELSSEKHIKGVEFLY